MALRSESVGSSLRRHQAGALVWALACLLLVAAAVPIPTLPRNAKERADRINKIANMTAEERLRLETSFNQWLALPPARRDEIRLLVAELRADQKNNALLEHLAGEYYDWLGTLPATDIDKLHREQQPKKRAVLVKSLMDKHVGQEQPTLRPRPVLTAEFRLSPEDRQNVLHVVNELPSGLRRQLTGLNDLEKLWRLCVIVCRHAIGGEQPRLPMNQAVDPTPILINAIVGEPLRAKLAVDDGRQHQKLFLVLLRTTLGELAVTLPDPNTPEGKATLQQHFVTLDSETQDSLMRSPPERFWVELARRYAEAHRLPWVEPEWFELAANLKPDPAIRMKIGRLLRFSGARENRDRREP